MELCEVFEKWPFLRFREGLFLAYKAKKGLKNLEHLSKRLKRINIEDCNNNKLT